MSIAFTKMSGSGNDFIIIDNRIPVMAEEAKRDFVAKVCTPKTSVGADGVIFIERSGNADFKWDFYNADGSSAEMCGNGARCAARYAYERKIAPYQMTFETLAGIISAEVRGDVVKVRLTPPEDLKADICLSFQGKSYIVDHLNTGVPHTIVYSEDVENDDILRVGQGIRFHKEFAPKGTNVNFVQKKGDDSLKIRTYERGVEGETLACGTGVVASAILSALKKNVEPPVLVETRGGEILKVYFDGANGAIDEVYLEGSTKVTFEGTLVEL
jgi:diaminopimelate epimerase